MTDSHIPRAEIHWTEIGEPLSSRFGDVYFSRDNGLNETRYVFLEQNQLKERFQLLKPGATFVIGETGFGSGLNFLACWHLWRETAPPNARLQFISVEKFPLSRDDLQRVYQLWPDLTAQTEELLSSYPWVPASGFHHCLLDKGRVELTLIVGDINDALPRLLISEHPRFHRPRRAIDAWFLDGFAPAKNPDMWSPSLYDRLAKLSHVGTTLATFTAAGDVRRGLQSAGFDVTKVAGYGRKRHMLRAVLVTPWQQPPETDFPSQRFNSPHPQPWDISEKPFNQSSGQGQNSQRVAILGGGLAGCLTAAALARRGIDVTVFERSQGLAAAASGNPQGIVYAKLSHRPEPLTEFNLHALQFSQRYYRSFWEAGLGDQCGVLQLAVNENETAAQERLNQRFSGYSLLQLLSAQEASEISGLTLSAGGLFYPHAGWLSPPELCNQLCQHSTISVKTLTPISGIQLTDNHEWRVSTPEKKHELFTDLVICTATDTHLFEQTCDLPLKAIRGQISYLEANRNSTNLRTVLCGDGYIAPAYRGQHCLGATYKFNTTNTQTSQAEHLENLNTVTRTLSPSASDLVAALREDRITGGRAALRCVSPDYLPLVGPAPRLAGYLDAYAPLRKNARAAIATPGPCHPNLYVNVGHGSRGLTYAPLCAEIVASQLLGEPSPVGNDVERALHPARFWIRRLIRNQL